MPGSLWLQVPLHPGGQGYKHHTQGYYQVIWGCGLSCLSHGAGISITASAVPLGPPPLCEKSAQLQMYNCVYLWCPDVLGRKNFSYG